MILEHSILLPTIVGGGSFTPVANGTAEINIPALDAPDGAEFAFTMRKLNGERQIAHTPTMATSQGQVVTVVLRVNADYDVRPSRGSHYNRTRMHVNADGTWEMPTPLVYADG